jgi:hypothetical protein
MKEMGIITQDTADFANSVRWVGNEAVHVDSEEVTNKDCEAILTLTENISQILYVLVKHSLTVDETHKPEGLK